jgi:stringent starvation protein B
VAAAQVRPVLFSLDGSVARVLEAMAEAAAAGVELIVFPETFLPYYPYFSFVEPPVLMGKSHLALYEQAVTVPGPAITAIAAAARQHGMHVLLGINERDGGSLYNTQLLIDANGEIVLNVSAVATNRLLIGNDLIEFEARFSGAVRQVSIPIENVSAIYAQETGHGMAFDVPKPLAIAPERGPSESGGKAALADKAPKAAQRPKLVPPPAERGKEPVTNTPDLAGTHRPDRPQDALPEAGSAPVLQAVESAPTGRAARSAAAPKSRRRGKLSAVPDAGEPASADAASIAATATLPLRIVGFVDGPESAVGDAYTDLLVKWNMPSTNGSAIIGGHSYMNPLGA